MRFATHLFLSAWALTWPAQAIDQNEPKQSACAQDLQSFHEMLAGAEWALGRVKGQDASAFEAAVRSICKRLIPYGRTYSGSGQRKETQVFLISHNPERTLVLQAEKGSLQLLVGVKVSPKTMEQAHINSENLFFGSKQEPTVADALTVIDRANKGSEEMDGKRILLKGDAENREIAQVGNKVFYPFELEKEVTEQQLADFLFFLWMASKGS